MWLNRWVKNAQLSIEALIILDLVQVSACTAKNVEQGSIVAHTDNNKKHGGKSQEKS